MLTIILMLVILLASPLLPDGYLALGGLLVFVSACVQLHCHCKYTCKAGWRSPLHPPYRLEDAPGRSVNVEDSPSGWLRFFSS